MSFTGIQTMPVSRLFHADIDISKDRIDNIIASRCGAAAIHPELVHPEFIRDPSVYKRFSDLDKKEVFRHNLLNTLKTTWMNRHGAEEAEKMFTSFQNLAKAIDENGALILASIIDTECFKKLIDSYRDILSGSGSKSWIHTYVNLGNHPEFLTDTKFNEAFLHPLLLAMVAYRVGGPIRIVDARGKDARPISVLAQDNMLHIDNTPFCDEYKVLLTWERNKPSGPKGQNFVFLPGTHKGSRNCFTDDERGTWSTENASIFITEKAIEQVFQFQKEARHAKKPLVVEVTHDEKPITTVFAAGSLVHHRFRTAEGFSRSCIIVAFHRASDNPGQLVAPEHLRNLDKKPLTKCIFGLQNTANSFLSALAQESESIWSLLVNLKSEKAVQEIIEPKARELSAKKLEEWKKSAIGAPTVEELKIEAGVSRVERNLSENEFVEFVQKMMRFDKHGPLDLILYSDNHEEIRKWARNQIREMKIDEMNERLESAWTSHIQQPSEQNILTTKELEGLATSLSMIARTKKALNVPINLRKEEKISRNSAYDSIAQLLVDLGESVTRCENAQAFLSTSLFLFLATDTLMRFQQPHDPAVKQIGEKFLNNYVSTAVVINKQIQMESM